MSISEYAQLMKESGIIASSGLVSGGKGDDTTIGDNKIQVEHILIFDVSERWERICKGAILGLLNLGRHMVDSIRIVAITGSVALALWGCSRLIASTRGSNNTKQADGNNTSQRD